MRPNGAKSESAEERASDTNRRMARACASEATFSRLKDLVFEGAREVHNAQSPLLDRVASVAVLRMEEPVLLSRDEELNVTVCGGRMVLDLPPGIEPAFGGRRKLAARVEYSAQAAADDSGMVYQMTGAEPIVFRLAAFELAQRGGRTPAPAAAQPASDVAAAPAPPATPEPAPPVLEPAPPTPPRPAVVRPEPEPVLRPRSVEKAATAARPRPVEKAAPAPRPVEKEAPERRAEAPAEPAAARPAASRPSFNCRYARSRVEKMICGSTSLAALDRQMSSLYYSSVAAADPGTKSAIRRSRDAFLGTRDRCSSEGCVAEVYRARIAEIRGYGLAD